MAKDGEICYDSKVTHRLRYKAWTAEELKIGIKDEAFKQELLSIQNSIIEQKKAVRIDLDMSLMPMPVVTLAKERSVEMLYEAPEEQVVTEAAFKTRHAGMTFKDAGMLHLAEMHEVEDGRFVDGLVEVLGEAAVYKRRRQFESCTMKNSIIDGGVPHVDSNQAEVNFQQQDFE